MHKEVVPGPRCEARAEPILSSGSEDISLEAAWAELEVCALSEIKPTTEAANLSGLKDEVWANDSGASQNALSNQSPDKVQLSATL